MHGTQKGGGTRPNKTLLELRVDEYVAVNEGAAGGSIGVLPMTDVAEATGARIASSASRKANFVPGINEGSAGKGNNGSSNRSEGVYDALMWGQRTWATTQHPMAAFASQSTSPLTRRKRTMMSSASYKVRCTLSSSSLEVAR